MFDKKIRFYIVLYKINYSKFCENIFNKFNMHFLRFLSSSFVSKDIASSDQKMVRIKNEIN